MEQLAELLSSSLNLPAIQINFGVEESMQPEGATVEAAISDSELPDDPDDFPADWKVRVGRKTVALTKLTLPSSQTGGSAAAPSQPSAPTVGGDSA